MRTPVNVYGFGYGQVLLGLTRYAAWRLRTRAQLKSSV